MTSLILTWKKEDLTDVRIAADERGNVLLFEKKGEAAKYAANKFGNYKVVEIAMGLL